MGAAIGDYWTTEPPELLPCAEALAFSGSVAVPCAIRPTGGLSSKWSIYSDTLSGIGRPPSR